MISKATNLKKTSVAWMPEIPTDWDLKRGKFLFKSRKVINDKMQCKERLGLTLNGVIDRFEGDGVGLNPNDLRTYQIFEEDELVFKLIDLENKNTSRVGYVHKRGIMSSAYIRVLNNPNVNMRYFYYQYFNLYQRFVFNMIGQGVRATMSPTDLLNMPVTIPPLSVQNSIVAYLDKKNNEIDKFIRNKEKLIKLLQDKINHIVSQDEDWIQEKAKWIFDEIKIKNQINEELLAVTQDRGVIPKSLCEENFVSPNSYEGLKLVDVNDYVISLRSFQGGIEYSYYRGIVSPAYNVIRLKAKYSNSNYIDFYKYYFKSPKHISLLNTVISGIRDGQNINWSDFKNLILPIPPEEVIKEMIPDFRAFEELKKKFEIELSKIEEYRNSIITDFVIGKRSVPQLQMN
jgi:type I restriction enzyme S subunit